MKKKKQKTKNKTKTYDSSARQSSREYRETRKSRKTFEKEKLKTYTTP